MQAEWDRASLRFLPRILCRHAADLSAHVTSNRSESGHVCRAEIIPSCGRRLP
jgi:hypothetical protein